MHEQQTTEQSGHTCGSGGEDNRPPVVRAGKGEDESKPQVVQAGSGGESGGKARQDPHAQAEESPPRVVRAGGESAQAARDLAQTGARMVTSAAAPKAADSPESRGGEASDQRAVMQGVDYLLRSGVVLSTGTQQALTEWIGYSQRTLERNSRALDKLMGCRTAKEVMDMQFDLFKTNMEDWLRGACAVFQISAEKAREAADGIRAIG